MFANHICLFCFFVCFCLSLTHNRSVTDERLNRWRWRCHYHYYLYYFEHATWRTCPFDGWNCSNTRQPCHVKCCSNDVRKMCPRVRIVVKNTRRRRSVWRTRCWKRTGRREGARDSHGPRLKSRGTSQVFVSDRRAREGGRGRATRTSPRNNRITGARSKPEKSAVVFALSAPVHRTDDDNRIFTGAPAATRSRLNWD